MIMKDAPRLANEPKGFSSVIVAFWAIMTIGIFIIWWMVVKTDEQMRANLLQQVRLVAQGINVDDLQTFSATEHLPLLREAWLTLWFWILLSLTISMVINLIFRRREKLERLVQERTIKLSESELRFRTVIEQAGDSFFLISHLGRFLDVNNVSCQQLDYSKEELLKLNLWDVDTQINKDGYKDTFQERNGKPPRVFISYHRRKDGTVFPVEINSSVIEIDNIFYAFHAVIFLLK